MRGAGAVLAALVTAAGLAVPAAQAADPLFEFVPFTPNGPPPPTGSLRGPCGVAADSSFSGRVYVADHHHDAVDVFSAALDVDAPGKSYISQLAGLPLLDGPCGLALDASDRLYVNNFHRDVVRFGAFGSFGSGTRLPLPPEETEQHLPTGVAVGPTGDVYVNHRTYVGVYDSAGDPVLDGGGEPLRIGEGTLGDGYGVAVSGHAASEGLVYVPDAADDTVKAYDPAVSVADPALEIHDPLGDPFVSLRDSAIAVDDATGQVYFADNLQPGDTEQPQALVYAYSHDGTWQGHLRHRIFDALPPGIAVDNSGGARQGRVYVTSGNTQGGSLYVYPPDPATKATALPPSIGGFPAGGSDFDPHTEIGGPAAGGATTKIGCEGDGCQILPLPPVDAPAATRLPGPGNPGPRYFRTGGACRAGALARSARKLRRRARRARRRARRARGGGEAKRLRATAVRMGKRAGRRARAAKRCRQAGSGRRAGRASASRAVARGETPAAAGGALAPAAAGARAPGATGASGPSAASLLPGDAGFGVELPADGGEPAMQAGSHPYRMTLGVGLDQGSGAADLRRLRLELPPGLLANPAATRLCSMAAFGAPRSTPFESESGENCPDRSQVGTVQVHTGIGGGQTRRFGLFQLSPPDGVAARYGAAPYGQPLVFDARLRPGGGSRAYGLDLEAAGIPQALQLRVLELTLWGGPGAASHDGERGDCLNEAEPGFAWTRCSIGEPVTVPPLAFLTLPTRCGVPLAFAAGATSWQQPGEDTAQAVAPPLGGCASLGFDPRPEGLLSVTKASSSSGFVFRLNGEDPRLANPNFPIDSLPRRAVVELPEGVTLNPSLGAGLGTCSPGEYADETPFNGEGAGCPNDSKIGELEVRTPFYEGLLEGSIYLAEPRDNPLDALLAVYLIAKSRERGLLVRVPGELIPDRRDGDLTAVFDALPQLPYTDLEVSFRSGQRAPLVSPPRCGPAGTRMTMTPWAAGAASAVRTTDTDIGSGIGGGPCPSGTPPFKPGVLAGGINSNVNSYTPYFVHLSRADTEQEITSYSLVLPKGVVGKLAGIPFCPEAAIAAARANEGFDEAETPSCPAASQVGRTLTGYGVGPALAYATGRIFLAGPYRGAPLSLVTVNSATVGPFDLGTVVVRSGFQVDPRTAQLRIDSSISDPIPHILEGIPLHLREVRVYMDRPEFTHNPSSCEPSALVSTLTGSGASFASRADDSTAAVADHFQLLNCLTLGFRPKLGLRLRGPVRRGGFPALRATFAARGPRDSNLKRIEVNMPPQLFLAQNHIRGVCARAQFAAGGCPPRSIYGRAVAHTPLLDEPLRGNVYLRSSDNKLPDLVTSLFSGEVRIDLVGRIGPTRKGGIQAFFDDLPDAPIDRFTMFLRGGRRGLLTNSVNICKVPPRATVKGLGQNNRGAIFTTKLRGQCGKAKKKRGKRGAAKHGRG